MRDVEGGAVTVTHDIETICKVVKSTKRTKWKSWSWSIITNMKNSLERLNSRFKLAEERPDELEESMTETVKPKENKKQNSEEKEQLQGDEWDPIRHKSTYVMGVLREGRYLRK